MDNKHRDGRAHIHVGGWESEDRRDLRADLALKEAAEAVARQLAYKGYVDPEKLWEELA